MELTDEVKKNITVGEVITDVIHYQKRINGLPRYVQLSKAEQQSIKDERSILDAKIIALANKISAATPDQFKSYQESLSVKDSDSAIIKDAKAYISVDLNKFYQNLHEKLLDATQKYAENVAGRLVKQLKSIESKDEYSTNEIVQQTNLIKQIGNNSDTMVTKIMSGNMHPDLEKSLKEELPSTPSAREAIALAKLTNNCKVPKNSNWVKYKDAIENSIKQLPAGQLNKITEERNVSRIFKNAINSICSVLGLDKPFPLSTKDTFKHRFLAIKEKAGVEEPAQDIEHKSQPK